MPVLERTQIYLPAKLKSRLKQQARDLDRSFSRVVIESLEEHLHKCAPRKNPFQTLLEGARRAEEYAKKHNIHPPKDLSVHHDYYLYGEGSPKFGTKRNV